MRVLCFAVVAIALAGCGGSLRASTPPTSTTVTAPGRGTEPISVVTTVPATSPSAQLVWCSLSIGESKAGVLTAMGTPHGSIASAWAAKNLPGVTADQVEWDVGSDIFLATFVNGNTSNLQAYDGEVGPVGAPDIKCPPFRNTQEATTTTSAVPVGNEGIPICTQAQIAAVKAQGWPTGAPGDVLDEPGGVFPGFSQPFHCEMPSA